MKLFVYKGFPTDFLAALTVLPLVDSEIASKKNVLYFLTIRSGVRWIDLFLIWRMMRSFGSHTKNMLC